MTGGPGGAAALLIDGFAIAHGYIKMFELDLVWDFLRGGGVIS